MRYKIFKLTCEYVEDDGLKRNCYHTLIITIHAFFYFYINRCSEYHHLLSPIKVLVLYGRPSKLTTLAIVLYWIRQVTWERTYASSSYICLRSMTCWGKESSGYATNACNRRWLRTSMDDTSDNVCLASACLSDWLKSVAVAFPRHPRRASVPSRQIQFQRDLYLGTVSPYSLWCGSYTCFIGKATNLDASSPSLFAVISCSYG